MEGAADACQVRWVSAVGWWCRRWGALGVGGGVVVSAVGCGAADTDSAVTLAGVSVVLTWCCDIR